MNKNKKVVMAVVSTAMAGAMVCSLAACTPPAEEINSRPAQTENTRFNASGSAIKIKEVGGQKISVLASDETKLAYPLNTEMNVNIVDQGNVDRKISYDPSQIAGAWTGVDGYTYYADDLKPAWWQFGYTLGIDIKDKAKTGRSGEELDQAANLHELGDYQLINSSTAQITKNATNLLDVTPFLDYMPNYSKFLDDHEIVKWSLTMNTTNGEMKYIPYFDGNDDIEKYDMMQKQWVRKMLDDELPATDVSVTFKAQAEAKNNPASNPTNGTSASAESFMGTTGSWKVDVTDPANSAQTVKVTVNYTAANTAAKDENTPLGGALKTAAGAAYTGESGNVVDLMNFAINTKNGEVKGSALLNILRAYIDVAYQTEAGAKFYAKRSDVFNSASAAWDADLMTAIFRCVVTNFNMFTGMAKAKAEEVFALAGREMKAQRQNDLIALAAELYGVRGMESRLEYTYIDKDGNLADARVNEASYEAAARMNKLTKEGLLLNATGAKSTAVNKYWQSGKVVSFMLHDYLQTQTTDGFFVSGLQSQDGSESLTNSNIPADFDFAPVLTPVSKWNDGEEKIMRFTESWRSVKNGGVSIPVEAVRDKPEMLSAALTFIDYLYSNDGQIVGSYGPMSNVGNTVDADGFWYGVPATASDLGVTGDVNDMAAMKTAGVVDTVDGVQYFVNPAYTTKCFIYQNKLYKGMPYKDRQIPIMTSNNTDYYLGFTVNGNKMDTANTLGIKKVYARNYTNYARGIIGAALPIGNKDQGFEYQCTAKCGLDGAAIVNTAIYTSNVIKHVTQNVGDSDGGWWYTIAPTCLPTTSSQSSAIGGMTFLDGSGKVAGIFNPTSIAGFTNVYIDLAFWGYGDYKIGTCHNTTGSYDMKGSAAELVTYISGLQNGGLRNRISYYSEAWNNLKALYIA